MYSSMSLLLSHLTSTHFTPYIDRDPPPAEIRKRVEQLAMVVTGNSDGASDTELTAVLQRALQRNKYDVERAANDYFQSEDANSTTTNSAGGKRQCGIRAYAGDANLGAGAGAGGGDGNGKDDTVQALVSCGLGKPPRVITVKELERCTPSSLLTNVLPPDLANKILLYCRDDSKEWQQPTWNVADRAGTAHHLSAVFDIDADTPPRFSSTFRKRDPGAMKQDLEEARDLIVAAVNKLLKARVAARSAQGLEVIAPLPIPPLRKQLASDGIDINSNGLDDCRNSPSQAQEWRSNFTLANWYRDVDDHVGAHGDDLSDIGPRAVIASVSFGAARMFRLKPVAVDAVTTEIGDSTATGSIDRADSTGSGSGNGSLTSGSGHEPGQWYGVRLPHNSLIVMWPPCQELWKHEVVAEKAERVIVHPLVGASRLNLTFRFRRADFVDRNPLCKCGHRCKLKPVFKEGPHKGKFFWQCKGRKVPSCDFFLWDDESSS